METTVVYQGYMGIMENKMETTIVGFAKDAVFELHAEFRHDSLVTGFALELKVSD